MGQVTNIFSNPYKITESWSAQGAVVNWGEGYDTDNNGVLDFNALDVSKDLTKKCPLMITGINLDYSRQSQQIYPLNSDGNGNSTKVTIKGAPQGILQITSVYSPIAESITKFLEACSRDCVKAGTGVWMTIRPFGDIKCTTKTGTDVLADYSIVWTLTGVELNRLGLQMQSGPTTIVQMPLNFEFTNLYIDDSKANTSTTTNLI